MPNFQDIAKNLLRSNPNIANNPAAKEMLDVVISGDSKRGQEIANNLLNTYGISKEEALEQVKNIFGS